MQQSKRKVETLCIQDWDNCKKSIIETGKLFGYVNGNFTELVSDPPTKVKLSSAEVNPKTLFTWTEDGWCESLWPIEFLEEVEDVHIENPVIIGPSRSIRGEIDWPDWEEVQEITLKEIKLP